MKGHIVVAESRFYADSGTGVRASVHIQIFMPRPLKRAFACHVHMHGIAPAVRTVGEDSMQALSLSVRLVLNTLARRHQQGWRFYLSKDDRAASPIWRIWGYSPRLSAFHVPHDPQ